MTVVITETGVTPDDWAGGQVLPLDLVLSGQARPGVRLAVDLPNDRDPAELAPWFDRLDMIRVGFPAMGDGRGFSVARRLRTLGYAGRLRAAGPLIADQATAARSVGFDEIEVPASVAARQPEGLWARGRRPSYRAKLLAG